MISCKDYNLCPFCQRYLVEDSYFCNHSYRHCMDCNITLVSIYYKTVSLCFEIKINGINTTIIISLSMNKILIGTYPNKVLSNYIPDFNSIEELDTVIKTLLLFS